MNGDESQPVRLKLSEHINLAEQIFLLGKCGWRDRRTPHKINYIANAPSGITAE